MTPSTSSPCPFAADAQPSPAPERHPPGVWPPGPASGLTGWGLLYRMSRDLLPTLAQWQQSHGDVIHLRIWPEHQIVITDPQLVRELLVSHHDALLRWERGIRVLSQLHGHSVLIAEGSAWRDKRQALNPSFTPKSVQAFVPTLVAASQQALAQWPLTAQRFPIESAITSLAMGLILRMMFSSDISADAHSAEQAVHTLSVGANAEFYWPARWPNWVPWKREFSQAQRTLKALIEGHLQARLAQPAQDWPEDTLTRLLQLHRQQPSAWPLQAVRDECMTNFLAGHETTAATLSWWAWCMAANPSTQNTARQEVRQQLKGRAPTADNLPTLRYLKQSLQESMRLYPVAPVLLSRRSTQSIALGGWQFPKGTMFMLPVLRMHHDPRWFAQPQLFQPERFDPGAPEIPRGAYMPFGVGPRVCLGQHLAMTEMTVIAALLLQRWTLAVPDGMAAPQPVLNVTLRPSQPLQLRIAATTEMGAI